VRFSCPLDLHGTPFQLAVWRALQDIPYGETRSYGQIAQLVGRPNASRAVGAANGANPVAIIVPCHRVIGSNGALTGYGGGVPTKAWLLSLEGVKYKQ
jgi:O-6-methylguanine DNA methyltransferase